MAVVNETFTRGYSGNDLEYEIEELKLLLFNFHNHVNRKLKKPIFEKSELDDKYSKANFRAIYNNFFI